MPEFNIRQPAIDRVLLSLLMWFLLMIGAFLTRLPAPYWINMTTMTMIFPFIIWYLGNTSLIISMQPTAVIVALMFSMLLLVTLTEGFKNVPNIKVFSKQLRDSYKNYGKDIKTAWLPFLMTMLALLFGVIASYVLLGGSILDLY
jgi:hypothetical protein|tara:strand:- start:318 stop:752 length:435 start_codon:yes stop_codon:yes gene_type:complete